MSTDQDGSAIDTTPSYDVIAERNCTRYEFVVCTVVIGTFCAFGLIGNVTSFIVFCKHKETLAAIFLLQCMAIVDSMLLIVALIVYTLPSVYPYTGHLKPFYESFEYILYVWPPAMIFHTVSIWLTVLVTVNRYNAVCRAVEEFGAMTMRKARIQVVAVGSLAALFNIPRFFEHQVIGSPPPRSIDQQNTSSTGPDSGVNDVMILGDNRIYQVLYGNVLYYPVMYILPLVTLMTLNTKLVASLSRVRRRTSLSTSSASAVVILSSSSSKRRRHCSLRGKQDHKYDNITICVIVIVFVFIVCQTPALLNQIFWAVFESGDRQCGYFHFYYTKLSDLLVVINSSCNFAIYCLFGRTFRRVFVRNVCSAGPGSKSCTCGCCCHRRRL